MRLRSVLLWLVVLATARTVHAQPPSELCSVPNMPCRYWRPAQLAPGVTYPLVIYLHGAGQRGSNNQGQVNDFADLLRPFLDTNTRSRYPAFVMAPQCPSEDQWVNHPWTDGSYDLTKVPESKALKNVRAIIANLRAQHPIDPDRIYVVGYSMGGYGTWDLVARTPDLFAAASPVMGGGPPGAAPQLRNLAVWAFHNADDNAVPAISDREMFEALARAGGRPIYTEGASGGHFEFRAPGNPAWMPWLFAQRRGVPSTPVPDLTFAPAGGAVPAGAAITLTSAMANVKLRYTIDGTVPRGQAGTAYAGPVKLAGTANLIAAATSTDDEGQVVTVFHAAPFLIGGTPLADAGATPSRDASSVPAPGAKDAGASATPDAAAARDAEATDGLRAPSLGADAAPAVPPRSADAGSATRPPAQPSASGCQMGGTPGHAWWSLVLVITWRAARSRSSARAERARRRPGA